MTKRPYFLDAVDNLVCALGMHSVIRMMSNSLACRLDVSYAEQVTLAAKHLVKLGVHSPSTLPKAFGKSAKLLEAGPQLCSRICSFRTRAEAQAYLATLGGSSATAAKVQAARRLELEHASTIGCIPTLDRLRDEQTWS